MPRSVENCFARRVLRFTFPLIACIPALSLWALTPQDENPSPPNSSSPSATGAWPQQPAATTPAANATPDSNPSQSGEVSSRDTPPTFKVRVNLVLVRVVVRDALGNIVANLKKDDFQLFDNRKPQTITSFNAETPESHSIPQSTQAKSESEPSPADETAAATHAALPQRFVALVFDDTDLIAQDTVSVRDAASRLFDALAPSDRVSIYSTSGQVTQEFTSDRELLRRALLGIVPRPLATSVAFHQCPEVTYYEADQIVNLHNSQALGVATEDAIQCAFHGDETQQLPAQSLALSTAQQVASSGDGQTEFVYRHLEDTMRRLASMPGQRIMVFVSPGFLLTTETRESGNLIDRANRANVVINTIDARGLYLPDVGGDIADPPHDAVKIAGFKASYRIAAQFQQSEILGQLADGTGGTAFRNRNDLDQGLRQAAAAPSVSYLLAFSPQNLKIDGRYHMLKVTIAGKQKYSVQARRGYYAPRTIVDPAEAAKEEIQEAIFSQEEIHDLPIDLQTQYFKPEQAQARLSVLTHVDVKGIPFRKLEGRNRNDLTIATAVFDENGNFVTGGEKIVQMRLLDPTLTRLSHSGFTVKSTFDIKPGTYLVRLVVRDTEGSQMAARNGAIVIPY
jgi:VWFA-related protein